MMRKDFENPFGIKTPKGDRVKMMSEIMDSTVMPGIQGGPLMHIIAAKAVAFGEALSPAFETYVKQVAANAKKLAQVLVSHGFNIISGGTDNHLMLLDLTNKDITGKQAEIALGKAGITVNKNMVPFDQRSPFVTSGIRVGTPAVTTRGMVESDMEIIGGFINKAINAHQNEEVLSQIKSDVNKFCSQFPLFK